MSEIWHHHSWIPRSLNVTYTIAESHSWIKSHHTTLKQVRLRMQALWYDPCLTLAKHSLQLYLPLFRSRDLRYSYLLVVGSSIPWVGFEKNGFITESDSFPMIEANRYEACSSSSCSISICPGGGIASASACTSVLTALQTKHQRQSVHLPLFIEINTRGSQSFLNQTVCKYNNLKNHSTKLQTIYVVCLNVLTKLKPALPSMMWN